MSRRVGIVGSQIGRLANHAGSREHAVVVGADGLVLIDQGQHAKTTYGDKRSQGCARDRTQPRLLPPLLFLPEPGHVLRRYVEQGRDDLQFFRAQANHPREAQEPQWSRASQIDDLDVRKSLLQVSGQRAVEVARASRHDDIAGARTSGKVPDLTLDPVFDAARPPHRVRRRHHDQVSRGEQRRLDALLVEVAGAALIGCIEIDAQLLRIGAAQRRSKAKADKCAPEPPCKSRRTGGRK